MRLQLGVISIISTRKSIIFKLPILAKNVYGYKCDLFLVWLVSIAWYFVSLGLLARTWYCSSFVIARANCILPVQKLGNNFCFHIHRFNMMFIKEHDLYLLHFVISRSFDWWKKIPTKYLCLLFVCYCCCCRCWYVWILLWLLTKN